MSINIYKDQMERGALFGKPVLFTAQDIPRETVPDGWHGYDLCDSDRHPDKPTELMDCVIWGRLGSVLSPAPLKRASTEARRIRDTLVLSGEMTDLSGFCQEHGLTCPSDPRKFILRPASKQEAGLFYSQMEQEQDAAEGTVGHLRMDFGGGRLHHSWWPHNDDRLNTPAFKAVLQAFMDEMRERGPLKGGSTMRRWCSRYPAGEIGKEQFGFIAETENYRFCLRCTTLSGDYCYLYCYDLNQQKLAMAGKETRYGLTETGLQALRDAADPSKPHTYSWYVIENINTSALRVDHELPLNEAIELYAGLDCADKRLGVTKDDITAVDLVIRYDGREWLSEDRLKLASFKDDPVVAEAVVKLQQMLEAAPVIGRVTFASGEEMEFTDPEKYLQAIREELPYHATTGFRCETLTDAPEVRKAVDDMLCDLYGEENPRALTDYGSTGMTMGGMGG